MASFGDCPLVQGQLIQMNAATGLVQHIFNTVPNGCTGAGVWGSPTIDAAHNMMYFVTGNAGSCTTEPYSTAVVEVNASDLSFINSWQLPSAERVPDSDFGTTPTLFHATINGVSHELVGMQNKNGKYYTFDRANIGAGPLWRAAIAVGGACPQCGQGTYLMVIAASTGQTLFRYQDTNSGSLFYGAASISNGVLYIGNQDGHLYAFGL